MCVGHGLHRKSYVAQDFCAFEKRYVFARKKAHVVKPVEGGFILAGGGLSLHQPAAALNPTTWRTKAAVTEKNGAK